MEIYAQGLIDELLAMREAPSPSSLERVSRFLTEEAYAAGFTAGIEQALDLLVPAAKQLALLPAYTNHGPNCVSKFEVDRIVGRVPVRQSERPL